MVRYNLKQQILQLRSENKSYGQIQSILGCSKSTISYYLGQGQKDKNQNRQRQRRNKQHPLSKRLESFIHVKVKYKKIKPVNKSIHSIIADKIYDFQKKEIKLVTKITVDQVLEKLGNNPKCYLTNRPLDLSKSRTYHFDHIIPRSKGGDSNIENLGIACKDVNIAKNNLLLEDFILLCKDVLETQGYNVIKTET